MKKYDIIVIGGGPAGLTASIYALRSGSSVMMFEDQMIGGQISLSYNVANYPGFEDITGVELTQKMHAQAEKLGLKTAYEKVEKIDLKNKVVTTSSGEYNSKSIILAMGAKARKLGVKNEEEYTSRGVHYCSVCDGGFYKGKTVLVVGGGASALEDSIYLSKMCKKVYVACRKDKFKAYENLLKEFNDIVKTKKIEVLYNSEVKEILVDNDKIKGVTFSGQNKNNLSIDGIFVAIGRQPDTELIKDQIKCDEHGYIVSDENMHTSVKGVFVAGDIRVKKLRQVITACADGAIAGSEASAYCNARG